MNDERDTTEDLSESSREEAPEVRDHRRLIELLNELRVALPGVQVLFAFLLVVPFQPGFNGVTDFQRGIYFTALMCTTVSTALLIAPSAYHRVVFRHGEKERLVAISNALTLAGLLFMALAIVAVVLLITSYLFGDRTGVWVAAGTALVFGALWCALPLYRRVKTSDARDD